jgi:CDGSH-type Zn-finger protein
MGDSERLAPGDPPGRPGKGPFIVDCPPGKYALCTCAGSRSFPYCDGTHRGTAAKPIKLVLEKPRRIAWCTCTRSGNRPFCDGSHADPTPRQDPDDTQA